LGEVARAADPKGGPSPPREAISLPPPAAGQETLRALLRKKKKGNWAFFRVSRGKERNVFFPSTRFFFLPKRPRFFFFQVFPEALGGGGSACCFCTVEIRPDAPSFFFFSRAFLGSTLVNSAHFAQIAARPGGGESPASSPEIRVFCENFPRRFFFCPHNHQPLSQENALPLVRPPGQPPTPK